MTIEIFGIVLKEYFEQMWMSECVKVAFTFLLLLLHGLFSAELTGIIWKEPGESESPSQAIYQAEPGRQGVCRRGPVYNQSQG